MSFEETGDALVGAAISCLPFRTMPRSSASRSAPTGGGAVFRFRSREEEMYVSRRRGWRPRQPGSIPDGFDAIMGEYEQKACVFAHNCFLCSIVSHGRVRRGGRIWTRGTDCRTAFALAKCRRRSLVRNDRAGRRGRRLLQRGLRNGGRFVKRNYGASLVF